MKITTIEMTAEEKAAIQLVANRLARLVAPSATEIAHDAIDKPAPGSLIAKAWKAKLTDAYEHSRMRLDPAEDLRCAESPSHRASDQQKGSA